MMKFEVKAYSLQELGQRQNQEDCLFPAVGGQTGGDRLFILCDGMGGHEKGEVASATVCEVMSRAILSMWKPSESLADDIFQKALDAAYDALDAKDDGGERKMGTTMTFVCLHANGATVAHIGDSRVYQLRPASGGKTARIVFRTQDHSLVNDLVKVGEITEDEAKRHPQKNVITRAMQPHQERRAKADISHLTDIQKGDYFYMCSDGMLEEMSDENILNIITKPDASNEQKIEILRGATDENKDNHTACLIYINNVIGAAAVVPADSGIEGTFVTTEPSAPQKGQGTKKWKLLAFVVGAIVLAVVAVAASLYPAVEEKRVETIPSAETKKPITNTKSITRPQGRADVVSDKRIPEKPKLEETISAKLAKKQKSDSASMVSVKQVLSKANEASGDKSAAKQSETTTTSTDSTKNKK
jgi:PPM family protein phosphatase